MTTRRIALFLGYEWHRSILLPLLVKLHELGVEASIFNSLDELKLWNPTITVVADVSFIGTMRKAVIQSTFVHICHGLISKNEPERGYTLADYVCAPSPFWIDTLEKRNIRPRKGYWPTGMVQMDSLFQQLSSGQTTRQARLSFSGFPFQFDKTRTLLLYAPTWNPSLNSVEMIFEKGLKSSFWNEKTKGRFSLVIKPHPHISRVHPEWIEKWQCHAAESPSDIFLVTRSDESLEPFIPLADMMISDCSSAIFHFLATERPQILVDNPRRFDNPQCFDPKGFEWTLRDIGYRVTSAEEISSAIARLLEGEDFKLDIRNKRKKLFFGEFTKGEAASIIASRLITIPGGPM